MRNRDQMALRVVVRVSEKDSDRMVWMRSPLECKVTPSRAREDCSGPDGTSFQTCLTG